MKNPQANAEFAKHAKPVAHAIAVAMMVAMMARILHAPPAAMIPPTRVRRSIVALPMAAVAIMALAAMAAMAATVVVDSTLAIFAAYFVTHAASAVKLVDSRATALVHGAAYAAGATNRTRSIIAMPLALEMQRFAITEPRNALANSVARKAMRCKAVTFSKVRAANYRATAKVVNGG